MERFVDRCQVAAVGFFSDPASKEAVAFTAAADTNDEINFGLITVLVRLKKNFDQFFSYILELLVVVITRRA